MRRKLQSRRGFTLTELLVALALMSILAVAMGAAVPVAARLYQETTAIAEANTLLSTLSLAVGDELHYAEDIRQTPEGAVFQSRRYGADASVSAAGGRVTVGGQEILSDKTYTGELSATAEAAYDGAVFSVELVISAGERELTRASFQIRPLNG